MGEDEVVLSSQVVSVTTTTTVKSKARARLDRLRAKFGDISNLENIMNITPKISEGADDDLVFCEKPEIGLSAGAEKLFQKFVTHSRAKGFHCQQNETEAVENIKIVTKKVGEDGVEVLCEEVITYTNNP